MAAFSGEIPDTFEEAMELLPPSCQGCTVARRMIGLAVEYPDNGGVISDEINKRWFDCRGGCSIEAGRLALQTFGETNSIAEASQGPTSAIEETSQR